MRISIWPKFSEIFNSVAAYKSPALDPHKISSETSSPSHEKGHKSQIPDKRGLFPPYQEAPLKPTDAWVQNEEAGVSGCCHWGPYWGRNDELGRGLWGRGTASQRACARGLHLRLPDIPEFHLLGTFLLSELDRWIVQCSGDRFFFREKTQNSAKGPSHFWNTNDGP